MSGESSIDGCSTLFSGALFGFVDFCSKGYSVRPAQSCSFSKALAANPSVFLTSGESLLGDLHIEGYRVGPTDVLDDELVLSILRRRHLNRTLRSRRVVLSDFRGGEVVDEKVYVGILQTVRGGLELSPRPERQEVRHLSPVFHLDLLAMKRSSLAQVGRLGLRETQG